MTCVEVGRCCYTLFVFFLLNLFHQLTHNMVLFPLSLSLEFVVSLHTRPPWRSQLKRRSQRSTVPSFAPDGKRPIHLNRRNGRHEAWGLSKGRRLRSNDSQQINDSKHHSKESINDDGWQYTSRGRQPFFENVGHFTQVATPRE